MVPPSPQLDLPIAPLHLPSPMTLEQAYTAARARPELLRSEISVARDVLLEAQRAAQVQQKVELPEAEPAPAAQPAVAAPPAAPEAADATNEPVAPSAAPAALATSDLEQDLTAHESLDLDDADVAPAVQATSPSKAAAAAAGATEQSTPARPASSVPLHLTSPGRTLSPGRLLRLGPATGVATCDLASPAAACSPRLTTTIKTDSRSRATVITLKPSSPAAAAPGSPSAAARSPGGSLQAPGSMRPLRLVLQGTGAIAAGLAQQGVEQQPGSPSGTIAVAAQVGLTGLVCGVWHVRLLALPWLCSVLRKGSHVCMRTACCLVCSGGLKADLPHHSVMPGLYPRYSQQAAAEPLLAPVPPCSPPPQPPGRSPSPRRATP